MMAVSILDFATFGRRLCVCERSLDPARFSLYSTFFLHHSSMKKSHLELFNNMISKWKEKKNAVEIELATSSRPDELTRKTPNIAIELNLYHNNFKTNYFAGFFLFFCCSQVHNVRVVQYSSPMPHLINIYCLASTKTMITLSFLVLFEACHFMY